MSDRLQKKCFFAAAGFHVLLLGLVLFGAAFFSHEKKASDLTPVDFIPSNLIDQQIVGGGTPDVKPPPETPPQPPTTKPVEPTPPPPAPKPPTPEVEKVVKQKEEAAEEPKPVKPTPDSFSEKPAVRKPTISLKPVVRQTGKTAPKTAQKTSSNADAESKQNAKNQEAFSTALNVLKSGLSPGTKVGIPGAGGEAYAGYENVVQSIYQRRYDQELPSAGEISGSGMEVEVSVTIARNGTVLSSRITGPSGNAALNKLVQRVLEKVTFIAPFPSKATDQQRTFNIIFDLKSKKALG